MKRIMIIGCGGAGKSTLARQLGEKLDIPVVHLDKLYWRPGWEHVSEEEFDRQLLEQLHRDAWILDGNFNRTMDLRLPYCDTILYLDYSRLTCLLGVAKRILTTYGTVRPDMGEGCPERFDLEFLQWVWNFNKNKREQYYTMLSQVKDIRVVILKNRRQTRNFLESL